MAICYACQGDTPVVTKMERLTRSIIDLNNIVHKLAAEGVLLLFLKDNMEFNAGENTNSMQTLLFNVLGSFTHFEAHLIRTRISGRRERTKGPEAPIEQKEHSNKAL